MTGHSNEPHRPSSSSSSGSNTYSTHKKPHMMIREMVGLSPPSPSSQDQKHLLDGQSISPEPSVRVGDIGRNTRHIWPRKNFMKLLTTGLAIIATALLTSSPASLIFLISNFILIFSRSIWDYSIRDPDSIFSGKWGAPGSGTESRAWYPTDFLRDVFPIPAHSHNDYWRTVPLFSAIHVGCTGVEADVWHFDPDASDAAGSLSLPPPSLGEVGRSELYVGHDLPALTRNRTFQSLYVDPIVELLTLMNPTTPFYNPKADGNKCCPNGIFDTDRKQTLVLLVDVKTDGATTWPLVMVQLQPLRERGWLSYVDDSGEVVMGPVTVVGTGNTLFESIVGNTTFRDAFFDAPLDQMYEDKEYKVDTQYDMYNYTNSFYASASIRKSLGPVWYAAGGVSDFQLHVMRGQIRGAHRRGLKVRYWSLPSWPKGFRNELWKLLLEEGVDYLNVDDLAGVEAFDLM
ncbi:hypothetical protein MKZ38_000858 [Zalerion maritima]|uniref:Altered inheritance of mitochondria protein 6 n=1 Tax=Zalerion maritima TaxID=339359 RepID=A0AAD5RZU8_9PEZI|nr:hypothetical protein MKZ38_000858 [Zalerion maritima]